MVESHALIRTGRCSGRGRLLLFVAGTGWLALVAAGLGVLYGYANAPGVPARPPELWPSESRLLRETTKPTLVLAIHPLCPCSRASLAELAKLTAECGDGIRVFAVFASPEAFAAPLEQSGLWKTAGKIPGVRRFADYGGAETRLFQAFTSGQALLYDPDGRLQFSGGITANRGHAGDNVGRSAIVRFVRGDNPKRRESFVFGCPLPSPNPPTEGLCFRK